MLAESTSEAYDASRVWIPELVRRFAQYMPRNEVPCTLRFINKATAAQFSAREDVTIHLSEPVPAREFALYWDRNPDAMRPLTMRQRQQIKRWTAHSGSVPNMERLLALPDCLLPGQDVLAAAAGAGHLEMCVWLRERGCPWDVCALRYAASSGHLHVCEWLVAEGCPWDHWTPCDAAAGGHVMLMEWLLQRCPVGVQAELLMSEAAKGCDVATLQRLYQEWQDGSDRFVQRQLRGRDAIAQWQGEVLAAAVTSGTGDWAAKASWLMKQGFEWGLCDSDSLEAVTTCTDWRRRLDWAQQHGCPAECLTGALARVAGAGDLAAARELTARPDARSHVAYAACTASNGGHLPVLELLHERVPDVVSAALDRGNLQGATRHGQLPVVEWVLERLGPAVAGCLGLEVLQDAVMSESLEVLACMHGLGCPLAEEAWQWAAAAGSEPALEWLRDARCPMPDDGGPYVAAAANGDVATLRCLQSLGCPLPPDHRKNDMLARVAAAVFRSQLVLPLLRWLVQERCCGPAEWGALLRDPQLRRRPAVRAEVEALLREVDPQGAERIVAEAAEAAAPGRR